MLGLQIAELPVHAFRCHKLFDLIELLAHQRQLLLGAIAAHPVQSGFQRVESGPTVFDELTTLEIVEEFLVFRIEQTPRHEQIELAAIERTFNGG